MTPPNAIAAAVFLILAMVTAGFAQTFWLKSKLSQRFKTPIDRGWTFRGKRIFGDNKTWRGFVAMIPAVGGAFLLVRTLFVLLPGECAGGVMATFGAAIWSAGMPGWFGFYAR